MKKILIIDDDSYICNLLVNYLKQNNYDAEGALSGIKGKKKIEQEKFDLVLCDYRLPDTDGLNMLKHIKLKRPNLPVIIITAYANVKMAVKLIKSGAFDYVTKPVQPQEVLQLIKRAIDLKEQADTSISFKTNFIEGSSPEMGEVLQHVKAVAPTNLTVLIEGETGSGKEYIARAIHYASSRRDKPFVPVDCGAIPKELANSELFGHVKGSFTGAINDKIGYFEHAKGGTLFLDEVGNLPYENQTKLLRALQEKIISKVGENKTIKVDVRLISATNEDLMKKMEMNEFREDLYHRLNEFKLALPSLRNRGNDIMEFTDFFIQKANNDFNKNISGIDDTVKKLFFHYPWHGNLRELQNVLNRAVLLSRTDLITVDTLPDEIKNNTLLGKTGKMEEALTEISSGELKEATELMEKEVITNALINSNYNKSKAAKILNIDRKTLYNKIKLYGIETIK